MARQLRTAPVALDPALVQFYHGGSVRPQAQGDMQARASKRLAEEQRSAGEIHIPKNREGWVRSILTSEQEQKRHGEKDQYHGWHS